jgi:hypothetical protein
MRILAWNSASFTLKRDLFQLFLRTQRRIDIIVINEAWIRPGYDERQLSLEGYTHHIFPHASGFSGLLVYVREGVAHSPIRELTPNLQSHSMVRWLQFRVPTLETPMLLAATYLWPGTPPADMDLFEQSVVAAQHYGIPVLVLGDLNARHREWDSDSNAQGDQLVGIMERLELTNINAVRAPGQTTHPQSGSVIDLALASHPGLVHSLSVTPQQYLPSDHCAICIDLAAPAPPPSRAPDHEKWDKENADWETFTEMLESVLLAWMEVWSESLRVIPGARVERETAMQVLNNAWHHLLAQILHVAEIAVGKKYVRTGAKHWFSDPEVQAAHTAWIEARSQFLQDRSEPNVLTYNTARRFLRATVRLAMRESTRVHVERLLQSPHARRLWSYISRGEGNNNPPLVIPTPGGPAGPDGVEPLSTLPHDEQESLENLARFFSRIFSADAPGSREAETERMVNDFMAGAHDEEEDAVLDAPFTIENMRASLAKVRAKSATDPQGLDPSFFKHAPPILAEALLLLFNFSYVHAVLASEWLLAEGLPLFKGKGASPMDSDAYRIISLTSLVARVFERLPEQRTYAFLDGRGFFHRHQFGFRRGHSTYDALFTLLQMVYEAHHLGHPLPVVFLDIKKAFDRVWHEGLLYKLHRAGIRGRMWRWFRAFLTGRRFRLRHRGLWSEWYQITCSTPQGTVLGPLFFLIYINDVPEGLSVAVPRVGLPPRIVESGRVILQADDDLSSAYPPRRLREALPALQNVLDLHSQWAHRWGLHFSIAKTVALLFNLSGRDYSEELEAFGPLRVEGAEVAWRSSVVYIGMALDDRLRWGPQFERVLQKLQRAAYALSRLTHPSMGIPPALVRNLVLAYLYSRLAYGLPFWVPNVSQLRRLTATIVGPLRMALGLPRQASHQSILVEFSLPRVEVYQDYLLLRMLDRWLNRLPLNHAVRFPVRLHIVNGGQLTRNGMLSRLPLRARRAWAQLPVRDVVRVGLPAYPRAEPYPFVMHMRVAAAQWGVPRSFATHHFSDLSILRHRMAVQRSFAAWQRERAGHPTYVDRFRQTACVPAYLARGQPADTAVRARLRFNLARLNQSLHRRNLAPNPFCPHCIGHRETPEHVLLECPAYDRMRTAFMEEVARLTAPGPPPPLSLELLLNPTARLCRGLSLDDLLRVTAAFLHRVQEERGF